VPRHLLFESVTTFTPAQFRVWVEEREARGDINHYELLHGRIVMNPPAGWPHGEIETELGAAWLTFARRNELGRVFGSSQGFELPSGDTLAPDVSFVSSDRWRRSAPTPGTFLHVVPDLVAEIFTLQRAACGFWSWVTDASRKISWWKVRAW
jgi:Uma2 family endonuclease